MPACECLRGAYLKQQILRASDFYTTLFVLAMLTRLRQQLSSTFGRRPNSNDTDADVSFPVPELPAFPNIDLGKGNTTSVVKVSSPFGLKIYVLELET